MQGGWLPWGEFANGANVAIGIGAYLRKRTDLQFVPYAKFLLRAYRIKRDPSRHLATVPGSQ